MTETKRQLIARILNPTDVRNRLASTPALELAALAGAYQRAKAEGRDDDARAIKRQAFELQAALLGISYDVFCAEQAAYAAERQTPPPQAVSEAEAALDQLDAARPESDPYEIRYNPTSHMFDVLWRGEVIDGHLPSYRDGEDTIAVHRQMVAADAACELCASPRRCLSCGDVLALTDDDVCPACHEDAGSAVLAA